MKPVCVPCQRFFRVKKNGFYFTEGMPKEHAALPGTQAPEQWEPYKIWTSDLWECAGCGTQILSGFGHHPIRWHHEADFEQERMAIGADQLQVNDC